VPQHQPAPLDKLLALAQGYAEFAMRNIGHVPPALLADSPTGLIQFVPDSLKDVRAKDNFANTARLICLAYGVTAAVIVLEAWMKTATPGEKMDMTEPPSEAFDRQEVIVLMGESHSGQKQKFLPIIRSGNGKFFNLGETTVPGMDKMEGRFAQILPPKVADAQMRLLAQTMLKVKGVKTSKPGTTVRLPRSRR